MLRVKKNNAPALPVCKMNCDGGLHHKLDNFELSKFLNTHQTTILVGAPGSGKTSMLYSLFKSKLMLKQVFDKIFIFMPSASQESMKDNIFGELPDEQRFEELTSETMSDAELQFEGNSCIIIDDMTVYLKDADVQRRLRNWAFNRRHLGLSIFILSQSWNAVPLSVRKVFNNAFIFKVNKKEMMMIFEEMVDAHKKNVDEIIRVVFDRPHRFLFVNFSTQRMFKDWDELIFS